MIIVEAPAALRPPREGVHMRAGNGEYCSLVDA